MTAPRAVVLVPRRAGEPVRDNLWAWLRDCWWTPAGFSVYEGHHDDGLFNRSAAINRAASDAGDWDVAVVLDADSLLDPHAVESAVALAHATCQLTFGFERFAALSKGMTQQVMTGHRGSWEPGVLWEAQRTASSCVVVPRPLWDLVGGFDESFVGWGFEDVAFSLACQSIGGGSHRIAGTVWHLWHPLAEATGDADHPVYQANLARVQPYVEAGWNNHDAMLDVLIAAGKWGG